MLENIAHIFAAVAGTAAAVALGFNVRAFFKEQRTTQANIFNDFYKQAVEILSKKEDFEREGKTFDWAILFLNHLEYLSILVNKEYLSFDFAKIYKPYIIKWYEEVMDTQLKEYLRPTPEKFSEFRELYFRLRQN